MINITVESKKYNCKINIKQKITIIRGESGRGKTLFTKAIASNNEAYKINVSEEYSAAVLTGKLWEAALKIEGIEKLKRVYIIDDEDFVNGSKFSELVKLNTTSYFVIINRTSTLSELNRLPFSVNEVYNFMCDSNEHWIEPYYKHLESNPNKIDYCIIEDSKSGYEFFKHVVSDIESSCGKDKIISTIKNNIDKYKGNTVLLIIDIAAFGSNYDDINDIVLANEININIMFNYMSFEYMILKSSMFNIDFSNISNDMITKYMSFERMCSSLLVNLTKDKIYAYSKTNINGCYINNCCCKKQSHGAVCNIGMHEEKIKQILKSSGFKFLIKYME